MKAECLAAMLAMAGANLFAGQHAKAQKVGVTVCIEPAPLFQMGVRPLASAMFADIGVKIDWRELDSCPVGAGAIQVRVSHDSTGMRHSEALAFAQPYEGIIVVFLDRVQKLNLNGPRSLTAHVLVHEITHVLEGTDRHSASGIMKAHWNDRDYSEMRSRTLLFAQEDVDLIYAGLKAPARAAVASR